MPDPVLHPEDISPQWVSALLKAHGHDAEVKAITSTPIGTGQVGATYRFVLEYSGNHGNAPLTLVGKFPSNDPLSRTTGKERLTYLREARFYSDFAGEKPLPVPEHLYLGFNEVSHDFTLIMRDLPYHRAGNQLSVPTEDETRLAIAAAAKIHAAWWDDPILDTLDWPNGSRAHTPNFDVNLIFQMLWPAFCDRYGDRVADHMKIVGDAYLGKIDAWAQAVTGPRCLIHNDFRPDNMLFNLDDRDCPIVIVDWQTTGVGSGASDIAYFMGTALDPATRRASERSLFESYIAYLIKNGVPKKDTENLWDAYRTAAFAGFLMGATAAMVVERTERGDAMFLTMCDRAATMVRDHGIAV
ncbi:MAG: phosphotransferase [Chakrabartia sp.]